MSLKTIAEARREMADQIYGAAEFSLRVEAENGWETDGANRLQRTIFFDVGLDTSQKMIFALEFARDSTQLVHEPEYTEPSWQGVEKPMPELFGYYINLDERGEFFADVRDPEGNSLMVIKSPDDEGGSVFEDGIMRDKHDISGLRDHLISLGVLSPRGELLEMREFEKRIEDLQQSPSFEM